MHWFLFTLWHRYIASYMEIGSQRCALGKHCTSKDLRHIIFAHGGNLASDLTKGGLVIGYHQTSAEIAAKIVHSDILPGTSGALGPGVYFAPTLDMTNGKAHRVGCAVVTIDDIGNPDIVTNWHPHFTGALTCMWAWLTFWTSVFDTGESQKRRGFDSTVGVAGCGDIKRPEFVVYDRLLRQTFNRVHDPLTRRAVGEWSDSRRSHWTPLKLALQSRTPETLTRRTKGLSQRRGAKRSSPNWQTFSQR